MCSAYTVITSLSSLDNSLLSIADRRKAMLHHYLEFVDEETIAEAERWSAELSGQYDDLEKGCYVGSAGRGNDDQDGDQRCRIKTPILFPSF